MADQFPDATKMVLSPAAQAVLGAVEDDCIHPADRHRIAAAALRSAADQVVPEQRPWHRTGGEPAARHKVRRQLLTLATELEGHS